MARPKAELPPAATLRAAADAGGHLVLRVTPGARAEGIALDGARVLVRVRAMAEDGKANRAALDLLARALGIAPSRLTLVRGAAARDKLVRLG